MVVTVVFLLAVNLVYVVYLPDCVVLKLSVLEVTLSLEGAHGVLRRLNALLSAALAPIAIELIIITAAPIAAILLTIFFILNVFS